MSMFITPWVPEMESSIEGSAYHSLISAIHLQEMVIKDSTYAVNVLVLARSNFVDYGTLLD